MKRDLSFHLKRMLMPDILHSMGMTAFYMLFKRNVTLNYPKKKSILSPRFRGQIMLRCDENGQEICIACKLCQAICPVQAITVEASVPEKSGEVHALRFEIDMAKCICCGLCREVCPVDAIIHGDNHGLSVGTRKELIFDKSKLMEKAEKSQGKVSGKK